MTLEQIAESLRISISPAIMISAIGLILLSMTNRIGRVVDRVRQLTRERRTLPQDDQRRIDQQLVVLARRGKLLRRAVILLTLSLLSIATMMLCMQLASLLPVAMEGELILLLFFLGIGCLIISLILFVQDLTLGLDAMQFEMDEANPGDGS